MLDDVKHIQVDFFLSTLNGVGTMNDVSTNSKAEVTSNGTCTTKQINLNATVIQNEYMHADWGS